MRNTSPLNISFSLAEKLAVLSKAGYVTKEVVVQMSWNVYHDDIEVRIGRCWASLIRMAKKLITLRCETSDPKIG